MTKLETHLPLTFALASLALLSACADDQSSTDRGNDEIGDTTADNSGGTMDTGTPETGDADGGSTTGDGDSGDGDADGGSTTTTTTGDGDDGDDDMDSADTSLKFDLAPIGDIGETGGGVGGPGSCRPSEIYGAAGGFPAFEDPNYADFLDKSVAIVTHNNWDGPPVDYSLTIVDISGDPPPPNMNYAAPLYNRSNWTKQTLGLIFGLTLDSDGNIYVAPTTVYGANPNPDTIRRIDAVTGLVSEFATLPNAGPAMGNLNYDCVSETIYVSNHEDGRIYQLDMDGNVVSTYKHATGDVTLGPANDPGEPDNVYVPLGDRVWAVQSHAGRLYYSVWWEDTGRKSDTETNEIWSVAYVDDGGVPDPATAELEIQIPGLNNNTYSNPVADISFAATGWMLVSQRTMTGDNSDSAHQSTTYEYDYVNGDWLLQGTTYVIGELPNSASGGVDHDFEEGGYVWMTGDALDFYTPDVVYGLQGTPHGGGTIENSTIIDLDNEIVGQDKTVYGDVEVPIPGDANPVPPPA